MRSCVHVRHKGPGYHIISILVATIIVLSLPPSVAGEGRQVGVDLPSWIVGDAWSYNTDDDQLDPYGVVLVQMQDGKGLPVTALLCNYPTSRVLDQDYTVENLDVVNYDISVGEAVVEPGDWMLRKVVANNPRCDAGDILYQGTYDLTENNTGTTTLKVSNLNTEGDDMFKYSYTEYNGDLYFTVTIDGRTTTTVDKTCSLWKPNWSISPMEKDDQWTQDCTQTRTYTEHWLSQGNLQGEFDDSGTYTYINDLNYTVISKVAKVVNENTYPEAYKIRGSGTIDWDWIDDQSNTASGTLNILTDKWYADEGDYWDGGWGIEYDSIKRLVWSTYGPPIDWNNPPVVDKAPPSVIDIDEEEDWVFFDYMVTDSDPGACGALGLKYSVRASYDGKDALSGLTIDTDGVLTLTPAQEDVADGYDIMISVSDSCPDSVMTTQIPFVLNIKNVNDAPVAQKYIMVDLWLEEGNTSTTDWTIFDVFSDKDMGISNLTGQPYDPAEVLTYTVQGNSTMWVDIDKVSGTVTFSAPDMIYPVNTNFSITIIAQDTSKAKAQEGLTVHILHVNHLPVLLDGKRTITIKEDEEAILNFEDYFGDPDIDDRNYPTDDRLHYFGWARSNMTVTMDENLFTIDPWSNWSGEEEVSIRATDTRGGRIETTLDVIVSSVNDPPTIFFQTPKDDSLEMDEPGSRQIGSGNPRNILLSITAHDIDDPDVFFNWTIMDLDTSEVLDWATMTTESMLTFKTAYLGEFLDGNFTGGDDYKEYLVEVTVTDGKITLEGGQWTILVNDINRPPVLRGIDVMLHKGGMLQPVAEDGFMNYTLQYGRVYEFSALRTLSDDDSELKDLECEWTGAFGSLMVRGPCDEYSSINVSAAKNKGEVPFKLKEGMTIITLKVKDGKGGIDSVVFNAKVQGEPPSDLDNFLNGRTGATLFYILLVALIMFSVGVMLARHRMKKGMPVGKAYTPPGERKVDDARVLMGGGDGEIVSPRKRDVRSAKGTRPERHGARVANMARPRKKKKKKKARRSQKGWQTVNGSDLARKVPKDDWEEDIPDDWK